METYEAAIRLLADLAAPVGSETVSLADAGGRVVADAVYAGIDSPRTDVSAMDGYAVRAADIADLPTCLAVMGEAFPGGPFEAEVGRGTCVRIFTGAPMPPGADRVVLQEDVSRDGDRIHIPQGLGNARHLRLRQSDFAIGAELIPAGMVLGPRQLVAAAAADVALVTVFKRPKLIVLVTGDELVEPGRARLQPQGIPESVSFGVVEIAQRWGARVVRKMRLADDLQTMRRVAEVALGDADVVVVTGGASVGERDYGKPMFGDALRLSFAKVAIKPGKPVWLGRVNSTVVLGLPGNPTSALVTARLFLAPLLAGMTGREPAGAVAWRSAMLAEALPAAGDRETFSRGFWHDEQVRLVANQDSGSQSGLAWAELLVRRPAGPAGFNRGDLVLVLDF